MNRRIRHGLAAGVQWIYPPTCVLCGHAGMPGFDICGYCESLLPRIAHPCLQCGRALQTSAGETLDTAATGMRCGHCLKRAPAFDQTLGLFHYAEPVSGLVQRLKFDGCLVYARLLASLWLKYQSGQVLQRPPDWIMPVPLHPARLRERGFNQAIALAKPIATALDLPLSLIHCERIVDTPGQTGLSARKRVVNVRRSFAVQRPITAKRVALVDDVMTTGSTAAALAAALKKQGVQEVDVWVMARAFRI